MQFLRKQWVPFAIFTLALVARLLYLGLALHNHEQQFLETVSGADCYFVISENLVEGNGYSCDTAAPFTPNSIRPPVQPFFLAGLYSLVHSYWLPLLVQIVLSSLVPLLGMIIASHLTRKRSLIVGLGVLLAFEPNGILYSVIFYSETVFTFIFLLSTVCLLQFFETQKLRYVASSALLLGLATLTKPTAEYVVVLFLAALLWQYRHSLRKALMPVCVLIVVFILTLSPWLYRNHRTFGVAGVSPQLGEQLYAVLVPSVLSFEKGTTFQSEFDTIIHDGGGTDPSSANIRDGGVYLHKAIPILLAHPKGLIIISANTALNFFIHDGMIEVLKHVDIQPTQKLGKPALFLFLTNPLKLFSYIGGVFFTPLILIFFGRIAWILITVFAVYGFFRYLKKGSERLYATLIASIVTYFMLTTLVIGLAVTARYRVPVQAFILFFAMYGMLELFRVRKPGIKLPAKHFKKLSIVIPAYNEERTIAQLVAKVQAVSLLDIEKEIIVVDNNSKDRTSEIVKNIPGVMLLHETAKGKGAAVKCGVAHATGDIVLFQDADLEYEPQDYPAVIRPILERDTDMVLGVRIEERHGDFLIYYFGWLGNHAITWLTNWLYWKDSGEYEGCYKAFTRELLQEVVVHTNNFDYDNELVCKLYKKGHHSVDVPIHYYPRNYAEGKKINWRHGFLILWTVFKCRFIR